MLQQEDTEQTKPEQKSTEQAQKPDRQPFSLREPTRIALLSTICLLILLAPDFVLQALYGNVNLALLQRELGDRLEQFRGLFGGAAPAPIALRNAIIGQESGGSHWTLNGSGSGAMGLGQVMPENLPSWSREALGYEVSRQEFLNNPDLQIKIIDYKLGQYWSAALRQSRGDQDEAVKRVASWWYSGDPSKFTDTKPQYWNGDPYPSIAEYSEQVLERFKSQRFRLM